MANIPVRSPAGMLVAQVDDIDLAYLRQFRWSMAGGKGSKGKYAARQSNRTTIYMHREVAHRMGILDVVAGKQAVRWATSVDHENGDRLDNRRANLRMRTRSQQMLNGKDALRRTNTSGHRGVRWDKQRGKWLAGATLNYRTIHLGRYDSLEEAVAARQTWEIAHCKGDPMQIQDLHAYDLGDDRLHVTAADADNLIPDPAWERPMITDPESEAPEAPEDDPKAEAPLVPDESAEPPQIPSPIEAYGWLSAMSNHYDEAAYGKDGHLGEKAKPREMTKDEKRAYCERLLVEQNGGTVVGAKAPVEIQL